MSRRRFHPSSTLRTPRAAKWLLGLALAYALMPFDLIPETIPFFGVVDDLVILPVAIRWMLDRLPAGLRADLDRA